MEQKALPAVPERMPPPTPEFAGRDGSGIRVLPPACFTWAVVAGSAGTHAVSSLLGGNYAEASGWGGVVVVACALSARALRLIVEKPTTEPAQAGA